MTRYILALMGCLLLATPARASSGGLGEGAPPVAEQRYQIGIQLYREGKYADAAREFRVAQTLMPQSAKLAYNIARTLERSGDIEGAIQAYDRYIELSPHAADRPAVEQVRVTLIAELQKQQARLVITSHPEGADIYLDGQLATPVGRTPMTVEVRPGDHAIRLVKAEFRPEDRTVSVSATQSASVAFDLRRDTLAPAPLASAPAARDETAPRSASWRPIVGWAAVTAGVGAVVVGAIFHAQASDTSDEGDRLGPGQPLKARALQDDLDGQMTWMWVGYGAGAVLLGAGAALLLWPEGSGPAAAATDGGAIWGWSGTW